MTRTARQGTAGFTLVEVLVALVLFALIGTAGFTMLDQVLQTQRQTEGRLDRLAELQRAMYLATVDFAHAQGGSLRVDDATPGDPAGLSIRRSSPDAEGGVFGLRYTLEGDVFERIVLRDVGMPVARQALVTGVEAVSWRFSAHATGWMPDWPPEVAPGDESAPASNPRAVELTLMLRAGGEQLRRVMLLPADAE